jgi:PKD repeat protein
MTQTLTAVAFTGLGSSDPDGRVVTWTWTFGDGASTGGASPAHAYATAGTYTVTLTVTDDRGASDGDTAVVRVTNRPPVANAGPDQSALVGATVGVSGAGSSDPDGRIVAWTWAFGDGGTGSGVTGGHVYGAAGTYTVTLTVTDEQGAIASDTAQVTVTAGGGGGGGLAWAKRFGGGGFDEGRGVAVDASGNVILTGEVVAPVDLGGVQCSESLFVAKYTAAGALLWARCPGGGSGKAVAVDADGNVVVAGHFRGTADFGGGPVSSPDGFDVFLARYAPDGAHLWSRRFGGAVASAIASESGTGVAVDTAGNVFLTGFFEGTANPGGGAMTSAGQSDVFLAKYSAAGAHQWSRRFGGPWGDTGNAVAVDASGNVFLTGTFLDRVDFGGGLLTSAAFDLFLVKYSPTGTHLWSRGFGGTYQDAGNALAVDAAGNVAVTGTFNNTIDFGGGPLVSAGGNDLFLARFGPGGAHQWSLRVGSSSNYEGGTGLAVDAAGNLLVAGYYSRTVDFGTGALTSLGSKDAFLARYSAGGAAQWARSWGNTSIDAATAVAVDRAGGAVATGSFFSGVDFGAGPLTSAGQADVFLVHLNP